MSKEKPTHFELVAMVNDLSKRVIVLEDANNLVPPTTEKVEAAETAINEVKKQEYPIPLDYRMMVDEILNRHFEIRIDPRSDSPEFEFTIIVPEQYSKLNAEESKMLGGDIRPKVLNYSDGANGVREWCEKVYSSFSEELKAKILADRV